MIQSSSLSKPQPYDQFFSPAGRRMLAAIPAVHSNLIRTSLYSISKYGKITGKAVHSNHFFKSQQRSQLLPMGGIEPHLNGYFTLTIKNESSVGVELESNCSRTAVNQAKKRPPQTLCTFNVVDAGCPSRRDGAERFLRSINLHFLSPFSNIDLSNIAFPFSGYLIT
jgi:hypothetical protein